MMITCPRCHFVQPEDRYCANCGVDMERYKPKPQPWHEKLLKNTAFQLSVVVFIVGAVVFYLYSKQESEIFDKITAPITETLERVRPNNEADNINRPTVNAERAKGVPSSEEVAATTAPRTGDTANTMGSRFRDTTTPKEAGDETSGTKAKGSGLFESDSPKTAAGLQRWTRVTVYLIDGPSSTLGQLGSMKVEDAQQLLQPTSSSIRIHDQRTVDITDGTVEFNYLTPIDITDQEGATQTEDVGMILQVRTKSLQGTSVSFSVEGEFKLRMGEEAKVVTTTVNESSQSTGSTALAVTGFVPSAPLSDEMMELMEGTPLTVLINPSTDLAIVALPQ